MTLPESCLSKQGDLLLSAIKNAHESHMVFAKFLIEDYGHDSFSVEIKLNENTWVEQEKSIDAMVDVRGRLFDEVNFEYFYSSSLAYVNGVSANPDTLETLEFPKFIPKSSVVKIINDECAILDDDDRSDAPLALRSILSKIEKL